MSVVFTDILGVISKYVPNKIITCNDKDAPWITPKLKTAQRRNARVYSKWVKRGRNEQEHDNVREVQNKTNKLIKQAKQAYYTKLGDELSDPKTGPKIYQLISITFDIYTAFENHDETRSIFNS